MKPAPLHRFLLPILTPVLMSAAVSLSGPVAGYLSNASGTELRAITGVPGAFGFSDPITLPDEVTRVRVAPAQDYALAERGTGDPAILFLAGGAIDHQLPAAGLMPAADWAAFSPTATAAILYAASANRLQVVSGLPNSPQILLDLDTTTLPEAPLTAAVSDDGKLVLVASGQAVYRIPQKGAAQLVLSAGEVVSLAVLRNGTDAVVSDRSTASVHLLQNVASSLTTHVLVSDLAGIGKLNPSADGATLFVAQPGAKAVSIIDLASGAVQSSSTDVPPEEFYPLRNRDTFLISAKPGEPGWIYFRDGTAGRAAFVPAVKAATETLQ